ncbi:MAG: BsuPI-related putative proteinase inhibitor [Gemmatimonadales bacterium]
MPQAGADSLEVSLTLPAVARLGEPVPAEITLTNRADRRLTLLLRGREIVFDLEVRDSRGLVVWRRLEEAIIPAILRVEELTPGQTITLRGEWPERDQAGNPAPAGEYEVQGSVLTEGEPLRTPRRRIRIEG